MERSCEQSEEFRRRTTAADGEQRGGAESAADKQPFRRGLTLHCALFFLLLLRWIGGEAELL